MRSILLLTLIAVPSFATGLDGQKLERLLGLAGHSGPQVAPAPVVPSPLPWRLLGTLRSEGGTMAAVEWSSKSVTLQVGDVRDGVEVIAIEQQTLIVRREGRLEVVGARPGVAGPLALPPAGRTVSRQVITSLLANPQPILLDVGLMPAMVGGKLSGFRARFVKEGSLVANLGLKAGDTIMKVNGVALDSMDRVFSLVQLLGTTSRFDVELERNGQRLVESVQLER
jgi:type II secretion system protein C